MSDHSPFPAIAIELLQTIDAALPRLRSIAEPEAGRPRAPGKWSPKQVIGHLIDSASNNHQRFVRAQQGTQLVFPTYEQNHWVDCQHYIDRPWNEIVTLWHAYNRHLVHVVSHIPEDKRSVGCVIGPAAPVTLAFLVDDYVAHLRHHLAQVGVVA